MLPNNLPGFGIEASEVSHRPLEIKSSVLYRGSDAGSTGIGDGVGHFVFVLPKLLSGFGVEAENAFLSAARCATLADAIELALSDQKIGNVDFSIGH